MTTSEVIIRQKNFFGRRVSLRMRFEPPLERDVMEMMADEHLDKYAWDERRKFLDNPRNGE